MIKNTQNALCTLAVIVALIFLMCAVRSEEYKKMKCVRIPQREYGAEMCAINNRWVGAKASTITIPDDIILEAVDMPMNNEEGKKLLRKCKKNPNCHGLHLDDKNGKVMLLSRVPPPAEETLLLKVGPGMTSKDVIKKFKAQKRSMKAQKAAVNLEKAAAESPDN